MPGIRTNRSASGVFDARCGLSAYQATGVFLTQGSRDSSMGMVSSSMETVCEVEFLSALHAADGRGGWSWTLGMRLRSMSHGRETE